MHIKIEVPSVKLAFDFMEVVAVQEIHPEERLAPGVSLAVYLRGINDPFLIHDKDYEWWKSIEKNVVDEIAQRGRIALLNPFENGHPNS